MSSLWLASWLCGDCGWLELGLVADPDDHAEDCPDCGGLVVLYEAEPA